MTTIRLGLLHPTVGGTNARSTGSLQWVPTARRVVGADGVLPEPFNVSLSATEDVTITVAPTTSEWVWQVLERVRGGANAYRYLVVPDSLATIDYAALVEVDPATLTPITAAPTVQALLDAEAALARNAANLTGTIPDGVLPVTARAATLAATYATKAKRTHTIVLGDSVDSSSTGWWPVTCAFTQGRMANYLNAGIPGNTTAQMLARVQADVIAYAPDVCVIGGPTNDIGLGYAEATTRANIAAIVDALRAANIAPVIRNCPPCDVPGVAPWNTVALRTAAIQRYNAWLDNWAASKGIPVLDIYTPTANTTTGGYKSVGLPYTGDAIHPGPSAVLDIARAIAASPPPIFRDARPYRMAAAGIVGENMFAGGVFQLDTNADGLADGWTLWTGGTLTPTLTAGGITVPGNWQNLSGNFGIVTYDNIPVVAGHLLEHACLISVVSGSCLTRVTFRTATDVAVGSPVVMLATSVTATKAERAAYRTTVVVPDTAAKCKVDFQTAGTGTSDVSVAQYTLRDLTALGI